MFVVFLPVRDVMIAFDIVDTVARVEFERWYKHVIVILILIVIMIDIVSLGLNLKGDTNRHVMNGDFNLGQFVINCW